MDSIPEITYALSSLAVNNGNGVTGRSAHNESLRGESIKSHNQNLDKTVNCYNERRLGGLNRNPRNQSRKTKVPPHESSPPRNTASVWNRAANYGMTTQQGDRGRNLEPNALSEHSNSIGNQGSWRWRDVDSARKSCRRISINIQSNDVQDNKQRSVRTNDRSQHRRLNTSSGLQEREHEDINYPQTGNSSIGRNRKQLKAYQRSVTPIPEQQPSLMEAVNHITPKRYQGFGNSGIQEGNSDLAFRSHRGERKPNRSRIDRFEKAVSEKRIAALQSVPSQQRTAMVILPERRLTTNQISELRRREIQQFKIRYPMFTTVDDDTFRFLFSVTDPEWGFDVRYLTLNIHFPARYPHVPFSIKCQNMNDVLPALLVQDIDSAIAKWIDFSHRSGYLAFRPLIRWIDRNLFDLFFESLKRIRSLQEHSMVAYIVPEEPLQKKLVESPKNGEAESSSQSEEQLPISSERVLAELKVLHKKSERLQQLDDLLNEKPRIVVQTSPNHGPTQLTKIFHNYDPNSPIRRGIEIKFRHVDFSESVTFVVCDRLLVSVQCKKCKKIADFQLLPGRRSVCHCNKCQTKLEACFGPGLVLHFNALMCYLELKECTIRDVSLPRSHFFADCQKCSRLSPLEGIHLGQKASTLCMSCNVKMTVMMDSLKYMDLCSIETSIKSSQMKKANKDSAIQAGKPLPEGGACKHYKKSFRWFRFPCCAKAYPCDTCHDVAEDHGAKFASRMICGFCAKEQPLSNDKCTQCSNFITGRRTAFWEGGKGCRNKLKMGINDPKKYVGMKKTISRKSTKGIGISSSAKK